MTKRKSLMAAFAFVLLLSLALICGISLLGGTLPARAADVPLYATVNGYDLYDGYYLESNDATEKSTGAETAPAAYVAWYKNGVLTLNGYIGRQISVGGDLTIRLKGDNTITTESVGIFVSNCENLIIDADSKATLVIEVTSTESDVFGISVGYTSGGTGNVTIKGKSSVNIICQTTNYKAFGIYSKYVTDIVGEASLDVKCVSQKIVSGYGDSYGIYSNRTPVFNTRGTIKIDTSECATASYCVYSASNVLNLQNGDCLLKYKKEASMSVGLYPTMGSAPDGYVMRKSTANGETVLKKGVAHTVTVKNGNDYFGSTTNQYVEGETVSINTEKKDLEFKKWIGEGVTFTEENATKKETSFVMPAGDVTVTADYNVFLKQPVFKRKNDTNGSVSFRVANEPYGNYYCIKFIKESGEEIKRIFSKDETSEDFTYYFDVGSFYFGAGNYMICVEYGGYYFYSEPFEIDYTDKTPAANVSDVVVNGKTGREITPVSFDVTLSYATFRAIADGTDVSSWFNYITGGLVAKISAVSEGATSATITISGTPNATATSSVIYLKIPKEYLATGNDIEITTKYNSGASFNIVDPASYKVTMTDGKAQVGGKTQTSIAEGSTVTIIANEKAGYVFDKWVVVSGGVTLVNENNKETTFVMPESDVIIKATYKHVHSYKPVAEKKATCAATGMKEHFECESCGKLFDSDRNETTESALTIAKDLNGHVFGELHSEKPATCIATGMHAHYECSACHKLFDESKTEKTAEQLTIAINPNGHVFGELHSEKPATCVATGTKEHKDCTLCHKHFAADGTTELEDITIAVDENAHNLATEWTATKDGHYHVCKNGCMVGHDEIKAHNPDRAAATETDPVKCTVCNYIIAPALGHTHHLTAVLGKGATCTEDGRKTYYACDGCELKFKDEAGTEELTDESWLVIPKAHRFGEWVEEVSATTEETGVRGHKDCEFCHKHFDKDGNEIEDLTIEKLPSGGGEDNPGGEDPGATTPGGEDPGTGNPGTDPGTGNPGTDPGTGNPGTDPGAATPGGETPGADSPGGALPPAEGKGLSGGAIAGIVIGAVVVAGIGGLAIFWFAIGKKSFAELIAAVKGMFQKK